MPHEDPGVLAAREAVRTTTVFSYLVAGLAMLLAGALIGSAVLASAGDRVVPCDDVRGLDALLGDEVAHVDGPDGGGGCVVPTTGAWAGALACVVVTPLVGAVISWRRRTRSLRTSQMLRQ